MEKNVNYMRRSMVWRYRWKEEALAFCVLLGFTFFINSAVKMRGLYAEDLYRWSLFADGSFMEYVFPIGGTDFRVLFNFVSYLEYFFAGPNLNWFVPINIIVNGMIGYTLYRIARRLSDSGLIGFVCALLYLVSRMSYFQIARVYGMMESLALWAAIGVLYYLYRYLNEEESADGCYRIACVLYFANCFIHERYMALLPLFFLALLLRSEKKPVKWLIPAVLFLLAALIRFAATGRLLPAAEDGSGTAAFAVGQAAVLGFRQFLCLLGIDLGNIDVCPMPWEYASRWMRLLVTVQDLLILSLVVLFILAVIRGKKHRAEYLRNAALFVFFIVLCIAASSVSASLSMQWIYVSMAAFLLFLAYMCGAVSRRHRTEPSAAVRERIRHNRSHIVSLVLILLYGMLAFLSETGRRAHYDELPSRSLQKAANSLADETWGKYGSGLFGKKIYLLKNSYGMSRFDADTFFRTFDTERKAKGTEVIFADSIREFGLVSNNMLILREDPATGTYQDITAMVRELKCEPVRGYYSDGWMDENACIRVMAGSTGRIDLELLYPGTVVGGETMTIRMDGEETETVDITQNILYASLQTRPYRTVQLEFENNFYLEEEQERRGEDRLSLIVNITAD